VPGLPEAGLLRSRSALRPRWPTGFLNVSGFFTPTTDQLDHMVAEGFFRREHRDGIYFDDQPARLLQQLAAFRIPGHPQVDRGLRAS
jgi:predicted Rossmann-fold nucleotide-binding protein